MSAFGRKADIDVSHRKMSAYDPKRTSVAHSNGLSSYLFRFSKVLPANTITTKMMLASASVRIALRAMPRPKCATTPKTVATVTAVPSTKIGTINGIISQICSGLD